MSLRALDLFSGTGSITKAFRETGHECHSLDLDERFNPTFCANVLSWDYEALSRGHYDVIWASCPCEQYAVARSHALTPRDLQRPPHQRVCQLEIPRRRCSGGASSGRGWSRPRIVHMGSHIGSTPR